jgi:thioester reductase-like protein
MQLSEITCGNVFLTGATGVLGAHLLKELLKTTDCDVYCLVRAANPSDAMTRLHGLLRAYDPEDELADEFRARVIPVLGDVTGEKLDLSDQAYDELTEKIDLTLHGAASTNLFARYSKIEPVNVGGTRNIVEFCLKTKQKYMVYISTYTVMGDKTFDGSLVFKETDLDVGQGFEHMSYQESKFNAEKHVRAQTERGLNWKIIRPGQIFGEAATGLYPQGQTNVSGLFYDIFKTIIETGVAIYSDTYFDVTPVDYVSRGTLFLALNEPRMGGTYHLNNPNYATYTETTRVISDMGYPIEIVPQDEYKAMLFNRELRLVGGNSDEEYNSYTTKAFKWWFRKDQFDFRVSCKTDSTIAKSILEPRGIRCPKIDHKLLSVYIDRGIKHNYFPAPARMPLRAAQR